MLYQITSGSDTRKIPGHRIELKACEDPTDPQDAGCAQGRIDFLRRRFLAAQIDEKRLELSTSSCYLAGPSAEIHLFPRVASLSKDGQPFLSLEEIIALRTAREIVLLPPNEYTDSKRKSLERYTAKDWMRVIGKESLEEWVRAGAKHPLYDGPYADLPLPVAAIIAPPQASAPKGRWWKRW